MSCQSMLLARDLYTGKLRSSSRTCHSAFRTQDFNLSGKLIVMEKSKVQIFSQIRWGSEPTSPPKTSTKSAAKPGTNLKPTLNLKTKQRWCKTCQHHLSTSPQNQGRSCLPRHKQSNNQKEKSKKLSDPSNLREKCTFMCCRLMACVEGQAIFLLPAKATPLYASR